MIKISGKYNTAKVFTNYLDDFSSEQIQTLCNQAFVKGSIIRLMPDVHAGAGCTIGTTMTIDNKIVPNLVGVDIGCGMETVVIKAQEKFAKEFNPALLDKVIYANIPSSMNIRDREHGFVNEVAFGDIRCTSFDIARAKRSIGTLGGGNHFIEVSRDDEENLYIIIHSGSRHLGKELAEYYQDKAIKQLSSKKSTEFIPNDLAYLSNKLFEDYINDMKIVQHFALVNRRAMMSIIFNELNLSEKIIHDRFSTIHNYIDTDSMILRKGAVSAKKREKFIIPINMRDGSLICEGLGNKDWNYSAPHGAGRIMSRNKAFETLNMAEYEKSMQGIFSTSVNKHTLDESPMAYKNIDEIIKHIKPTAKILKRIKPVYNFKAAEGFRKRRK